MGYFEKKVQSAEKSTDQKIHFRRILYNQHVRPSVRPSVRGQLAKMVITPGIQTDIDKI